jgi:hypothetical protein
MQNAHGCYLIGRVGKRKKGLLQLTSCCSVGEMIMENQRSKKSRLHWMTLVEKRIEGCCSASLAEGKKKLSKRERGLGLRLLVRVDW